MSCSPATIRAPGIGWHRDRDVFEKVVGISLRTPATLRFRAAHGRAASIARASKSRRAPLTCSRAKSGGTGSTASCRAISSASRSPSAPCRTKGRRIAAQRDGTVRRRNGFRGMRVGRCCCLLLLAGCSKGPRGGPPIYQAGAFARRRMGAGQPAGEPGQADDGLCREHARWLHEQLQTASSSLTQPNSRLRGGDPGAAAPSPRMRAPEGLRAHVGEAQADRGPA